ncbi:MAG: PmeII family type II restriction endonuclease [Coriobacteriia bacterium]|nr:PmeII family type II restriction endonuclease [Coriobacteriia bacterium]
MADTSEDPKELLKRELKAFGTARAAWYRNPRSCNIKHLLKKDVLMFAARGVKTADEFVDEAFRAYESSSEEGVMGTLWQAIVTGLSSDTLDTGDLTTDRDGALWACELKAQKNTTNSSSSVQELRDLKARMQEMGQYKRSTKKPIKGAYCVLRGPDVDEEREFKPRRAGKDEDLRGFKYRYLSGRSLWRWLTGVETPIDLIGNLDDLDVDDVLKARAECVARLKKELAAMLKEKKLGTTIQDVLKLV